MRTNGDLLKEVMHILHSDPGIDATNIIAKVENGVVILTGTVHSPTIKWMAKEAIRHINGIKEIKEDLRVKPLSSE